MSAPLQAVLIEAFSERPFAGNGAAVVLLREAWDDGRLQALATSLRQSETAFLLHADHRWLLRWFTPTCEVDLCGHATLAAMLALGHWSQLTPGVDLALHSRSGPLTVRLDAGLPWCGSIDLPNGGLLSQSPPAELASLLERHGLGQALEFWGSGLGYWVVLLEPGAPLDRAGPIAADLSRIGGDLARGLVLMQAGSTGVGPSAPVETVAGFPVDYRLRFFAPGLGIPEDPVTGSAHALVAPWWQQQLGQERVVGWQCSDRPGGVVCEGLPSGMIRLSGSGHLLWDGTLHTQTSRQLHAADGDGNTSGPALCLPGGWQLPNGKVC